MKKKNKRVDDEEKKCAPNVSRVDPDYWLVCQQNCIITEAIFSAYKLEMGKWQNHFRDGKWKKLVFLLESTDNRPDTIVYEWSINRTSTFLAWLIVHWLDLYLCSWLSGFINSYDDVLFQWRPSSAIIKELTSITPFLCSSS